MEVELKVLVSTISDPASRKSMWICLIRSERVRVSKSLLPLRSQGDL